MRITWVPARTHDEGNSGDVEEVAQMMIDALDTVALRLLSSLAIHWNPTPGKAGSIRSLSDSTRELSVRLTMVHDFIEGKDWRWRMR